MFSACLTAALLVLLEVPAGPHRASPQTQQEILDRALAAHRSGDLEAAVVDYQRLLKLFPNRAGLLTNLGAALVGLGRFQEAIEQYRRALELEPDNPEAGYNLGLAYYKTFQFVEAAAQLKQFLDLQPENHNARLLLADCLLRTGTPQTAIDLLAPLEQSNPDDLAVAYLLGTALLQNDQIDRGRLLIDRIFRAGESAEGHLLLGTAHLMSRDYPAALGEFEKAASLNPSLPALQAFYGKALMAVGSREEAARAFRAELRSDPHSYEANLYLGVLEAEERRHQEALRHFRKALAVRPESIEARYQLATLHLTMEDSIEALAILEPIVAEAPAFVEAHISLATVYHRLGRREDARRHRSVVAELNAKKQAQAPGAGDELGPAYRGELPKPPAPSQEPPQRDPSQGDRK